MMDDGCMLCPSRDVYSQHTGWSQKIVFPNIIKKRTLEKTVFDGVLFFVFGFRFL